MERNVEIPSILSESAASGTGAQAVERALQLLSIVGRRAEKGIALGDVVSESGLNKPTARRLLMALMRSRLVEQDELTRRYYLGGELYVLGMLASRRHGLLEMAGESLKRLSAASGDTSFVSMRRDDYAVCLHREEGAFPVRTHALLAGDQNPLGVGAGSLAMLAALPDAEVAAIIDRIEGVVAAQYPGYSPEIIGRDVARTREQGYALNPGRVIANSWGIGMAILLPDGRLAGALSIAAIDSRMNEMRQKELMALLRQEVERVQGKLKALFGGEKAPIPKPQLAARTRAPERV
ncbi:IclR family transcriptional regulator [Neorhizobium sp. R1-B]|uniref:IclR family transcriptional regulator n=1 Tax=unclassified Neorhizobium TaxID=2629175 RepID=UPI00104560AF|nr:MULTISPECIES: IclR family transcriptional regulator [unclassified Neorhizobium]TCV70078.1 IclR family transcriptional regulator [Neorhizobium sp. S3-V5DH]TDX80420.1 IclR family transcriptional regulator [Neorhizobium sp. R1-B]